MFRGLLNCIVATSSLELGIDWGNISLIIQVGAPKGISRMIQRIEEVIIKLICLPRLF